MCHWVSGMDHELWAFFGQSVHQFSFSQLCEGGHKLIHIGPHNLSVTPCETCVFLSHKGHFFWICCTISIRYLNNNCWVCRIAIKCARVDTCWTSSTFVIICVLCICALYFDDYSSLHSVEASAEIIKLYEKWLKVT